MSRTSCRASAPTLYFVIATAIGSALRLRSFLTRAPLSCAPSLTKGLADPVLAPVNDNCLPGDESSIIARQKQNCARHILRLPHALDGLLFPGAALLLVRLRRGCQSIRKPRQHSVRRDAIGCNIVRQPSHETDDAHLCGNVVAHAGNG